MAKKIKNHANGQTVTIVRPSLIVEGETHPLVDAFKNPENLPTLKSVGYCRIPEGWISYVITTKGKEVLSIDVEEPNILRPIAEESAKIAFVSNFIDPETL